MDNAKFNQLRIATIFFVVVFGAASFISFDVSQSYATPIPFEYHSHHSSHIGTNALTNRSSNRIKINATLQYHQGNKLSSNHKKNNPSRTYTPSVHKKNPYLNLGRDHSGNKRNTPPSQTSGGSVILSSGVNIGSVVSLPPDDTDFVLGGLPPIVPPPPGSPAGQEAQQSGTSDEQLSSNNQDFDDDSDDDSSDNPANDYPLLASLDHQGQTPGPAGTEGSNEDNDVDVPGDDTLDQLNNGLDLPKLMGGENGTGETYLTFTPDNNIQSVPEPSTVYLAGIGLIGLLIAARRRPNTTPPGR